MSSQRQKRLNIDFSNSRSRLSQRTNEATLIVGRNKDPEDNARNNKPQLSINVANTSTSKVSSSRKSDPNTPIQTSRRSTLPTTATIENSVSPSIYNSVNLTVKFHEARTSSESVLVDPKSVPGAKAGDLGEIQCLSGSKKKFFFVFHDLDSKVATPTDNSQNTFNDSRTEQNDNNVRQTTAMNPTLETILHESNSAPSGFISILSGSIVSTLNLKPRDQVAVKVRTREAVQADTIEIYVKDIHLSRGDMWHISNLIADQCVYKNQKISYLNGSIRLSINKIYKNGHKYYSSYISKDTKVVFRSDSARLIVFIQISSEMWHFEESGQQMFHKLVNSFFPKVFQKWRDMGTHHLITIILFTSVDLDGENIKYSEGETPGNKSDYYRVVVDQVHILLWNEIMATLRLEFANFKRDVYLHKNQHRDAEHPQEYIIQGTILPSVKGSFLEAINLGMSLVSDDFKDSYLRQTTNHFIMITPGTGLFDVSYDMLIKTSKIMTTVDSTVDIICLSQQPLHVVPLVRFLDNQNRLKHCIPHWLDISFWTDSSQAVHQWLPKCRIHELQMMGVMENELSNLNLGELDLSNHGSMIEAMQNYDDNVFDSAKLMDPIVDQKKIIPKHKQKLISNVSSLSSRKSVTPENNSDEGLKPADLIGSNKTSSPATSTVFGVSTTSKPNVSAFSTLLSLSKNANTESSSASAINFVKKMISSPMLKPRTADPTSSVSSKTASNSSRIRGDDVDSISLNETESFDEDISRKSTERMSSRKSSNSLNIDLHESNRNVMLNKGKNNFSLQFSGNELRRNSVSRDKKKSEEKNTKDGETNSNTYWIDITNPSNILNVDSLNIISYGKWKFVFPPNVRKKSVKWTSLCSPASLPTMTTIFPSLSDFNQNYTFRIYDVILNQNLLNENQTNTALMKSMISLRLTLGFQICVGEKVQKVEKHRKPNGDVKLLIQSLDNSANINGKRVYLSLSNEIHRICCEFNGLINVQVYKKIANDDEKRAISTTDKQYLENIRTRYSEEYLPVLISQKNEYNTKNYNWNQLDQVLAGYDESIDKKLYHRMKFVILPSEIPENVYSITNENLTTEEIRLEGIRSLIMNIYKIRFRTNEEKKIKKKLEVSPEIYFYTGSLFQYLRHESNEMRKNKANGYTGLPSLANVKTASSSNSGNNSSTLNSPIIRSQFHKYNKSINILKLVNILQSEEGIPVIDRYWHLKKYQYVFLGMDLVSFLTENFEDIDTREEAVEFGNSLMEQNVFYHAVATHKFLDGHYFYYFNKKLTEEATNFANYEAQYHSHRNSIQSQKSLKSGVSGSGTITSQELDINDDIGEVKEFNKINSADSQTGKGETITLSKEVLCDLDPNGYSWQPELVKVHYDIVHNPEHCFHIRIEWLNTTSKLIEDLINGWSKYCERYGLSLVEIPWDELFTLPITNPLHSTIEIDLALNPWIDDEFSKYSKIFEFEKYYFHLYLLKRGSFMLDNRTANYFKNDEFDVSYSWGKPMFKYAQFIHSTGGYIAELRNNGDFFLAPNNAHISRLNLNIGKLHNLGKRKAIYFDSQSVMLEFREICGNEKKLREIFREGVEAYENNEELI